jgi:alpha-D-ribose 1-methylphosphonate 5-phosphate C-P lyase
MKIEEIEQGDVITFDGHTFIVKRVEDNHVVCEDIDSDLDEVIIPKSLLQHAEPLLS